MIKKILLFTGLLLGFLVIAFFLFVYFNKPDYSGKLDLNGLQEEVTVYFDEVGVPHIYAQNETDAYFALGYLHAQDRLWQMELVRRVGAGRLSEVFGESMVETDKFFRGIGIAEASEASLSKIDTASASYLMARAYINGINLFIDNGATPVEFRLLGIKKENYTVKDIFNVYGYMAFSFAQAHKTDPFLTGLNQKLGSAYLEDLDIKLNPGATIIQNYHRNIVSEVASNISGAVNSIMETLPVPPFIGSNSWVIGAKKTKNGKVILANDPHIGYSQPAVWYQSHIVTPNYEMYGFNLALTPFPLLGHNRKYAYGLTMFQNDDIDFYLEDSLQQFGTRKEIIKVKDEDDVFFEVRTGKGGRL
ncbi:MAG: penicillin acylase family protein [Flavobacteriaceae bacterium]|nr:penicillin acylase family protein [Flavobacteriaceae bacterium]